MTQAKPEMNKIWNKNPKVNNWDRYSSKFLSYISNCQQAFVEQKHYAKKKEGYPKPSQANSDLCNEMVKINTSFTQSMFILNKYFV